MIYNICIKKYKNCKNFWFRLKISISFEKLLLKILWVSAPVIVIKILFTIIKKFNFIEKTNKYCKNLTAKLKSNINLLQKYF
jgi:hypothetical protein